MSWTRGRTYQAIFVRSTQISEGLGPTKFEGPLLNLFFRDLGIFFPSQPEAQRRVGGSYSRA